MLPRLLLGCACIVVLTAASAAYEWNPVQKRVFMEDCLKSCRDNPTVSEPRKPLCTDYCQCVMKDGQDRFSAAEYDQMDDDSRAGRKTPKLEAFAALFPVCNRRAFGR
jgi:hypothetical protein